MVQASDPIDSTLVYLVFYGSRAVFDHLCQDLQLNIESEPQYIYKHVNYMWDSNLYLAAGQVLTNELREGVVDWIIKSCLY